MTQRKSKRALQKAQCKRIKAASKAMRQSFVAATHQGSVENKENNPPLSIAHQAREALKNYTPTFPRASYKVFSEPKDYTTETVDEEGNLCVVPKFPHNTFKTFSQTANLNGVSFAQLGALLTQHGYQTPDTQMASAKAIQEGIGKNLRVSGDFETYTRVLWSLGAVSELLKTNRNTSHEELINA